MSYELQRGEGVGTRKDMVKRFGLQGCMKMCTRTSGKGKIQEQKKRETAHGGIKEPYSNI